MRITSLILTLGLGLFGYSHLQAQSWVDQIHSVILEEKATVVVSDYFADRNLFDQINRLRQQKFQAEELPFDTTGQYTKAKKQLNQFLKFTSQNIGMIPIRNNGSAVAFRKILNFEDSGQMVAAPGLISKFLVDQIFEKGIKNCLSTWFGDNSKNQVFRLNGLSAVTAMKLLITFEKQDDMVKLTWKYVSSYTLNTWPDNMVRSYQEARISKLKKP